MRECFGCDKIFDLPDIEQAWICDDCSKAGKDFWEAIAYHAQRDRLSTGKMT